MRSSTVAALLALALALPGLAHAGSTLRVVTWNLRHEGWSGDQDYLGDAEQIWFEFGGAASSPNGADLAFLQEVMDVTVPTKIANDLTSISGFTWVGVASDRVGRSSYKESYGMVYRPDRVDVVSAALYNDVGDLFEREPWVVKIRDHRTLADFTFLDWHAVFGTSTQRAAELRQIATAFLDVQNADATDQDVILLGDHNAPCISAWWATVKAIPGMSCMFDGPTTLNSKGGWASAYDHVWIQTQYTTELSSIGRDYVQDPASYVGLLSDHAPVDFKLYSRSDTD